MVAHGGVRRLFIDSIAGFEEALVRPERANRSVLRLRGNGHETALREFRIREGGSDVADTFASAEAILSGTARLLHEA